MDRKQLNKNNCTFTRQAKTEKIVKVAHLSSMKKPTDVSLDQILFQLTTIFFSSAWVQTSQCTSERGRASCHLLENGGRRGQIFVLFFQTRFYASHAAKKNTKRYTKEAYRGINFVQHLFRRKNERTLLCPGQLSHATCIITECMHVRIYKGIAFVIARLVTETYSAQNN